MNSKLIIIGASGHGKVVADIAVRMGRYDGIIFLDDNTAITECAGFPVIGDSKSIDKYIKDHDIFVAIGDANIRQRFQDYLFYKKAVIPSLVHPCAIIGRNVRIGEGTVIMAGAVVNPESNIGKGCILNTCSSVDHDCIIKDYVHVSVGAHVAGRVVIGDRTWIGIGAIVSNNLRITSDCMIGAGGVVIKNLAESGTYIGIPVKCK